MLRGVCGITVLLLASAMPARADMRNLPPLAEVDQALENYPGVEAAEVRIAAARAQAEMLRVGPHEFVLSGSYTRRDVDREGRYHEMDATLSRAIRLPGKAKLDREAGALGIEVATNRSEDVHHQAALLLSDYWFDWLAANELVRNDQQTVAALEGVLSAVEKRVQATDAAPLEADQARAALAAAQAQLANSTMELEKARVSLSAVFPEITLAPDAGLSDPELPPQPITHLRDLIISRSHEIGAADKEAQRLSTVAHRARSDRLPDPTLGIRTFNERGGIERGVSVSLSIPLGGSLRQATAQRAAADAHAAEYDVAEVRRRIHAIADSDVSSSTTRMRAWESMRVAAASADKAAQRTVKGHDLGAIDMTDMLLVQKQANDARRAEIDARANAARAVTRLLIDAHEIWTIDHD